VTSSHETPIIANSSTDIKGKTEEIINRGIDKTTDTVPLLTNGDPTLHYGLTTLIMTLYTQSGQNIKQQLGLKTE